MAKTAHKKYVEKCLNELHSIIIRRRARGKCELCNEQVGFDYLERHHIFGRKGWMIYDLEGSAGVCTRTSTFAPNGCHALCKEKKEFVLGLFAQIRGKEWFTRIQEKSRETKQWREPEMQVLLDIFKGLV